MYKKDKFYKKELGVYRKEIDKIDNNNIRLLDEREKLVKYIRKIKEKYNIDIYQAEREKEIIERMKSKFKVLKDTNIESIWKEIIKNCKLLQALEVSDKN